MDKDKKFNDTYLFFPMEILKNGMKNIRGAVDDVMDYCFYEKAEYFSGDKKYRLRAAAEYLKITFNFPTSSYARGEELYKSIPQKSPKTSIRRDMILDFYGNDKSEFQVVCFLAFCAIRSIIQRSPSKKTNNKLLLRRMAGNISEKTPLPEWLNKYSKRYWLDQIKTELQLNWGLKLYGHHTRGFYVSFQMELPQLIEVAEGRRIKTRVRQLTEEKKAARQAVINKLEMAIKQTAQKHSYLNN